MSDLVVHLESYLGPIVAGSGGGERTPEGVQVLRYGPDRPFDGALTLTTLGLSNHHLAQPGGAGLHQELVLHLPAADPPRNAAAVLFQVAGQLVRSGRGLLRGEVLGPHGPVFGTGTVTALYAAAPGYVPDGFGVCRMPARTVVLTWLVPITAAEAAFVAARGWQAFERALVAEDPDLTDLGRASLAAVRDGAPPE
ncbi:suppressor of fused domain protein [Spirilliplanes yamanashiensis]|uniref:Suppressor of fused-like domain-containing protein n=1 Tax=Spirilliplanes yamanashiensis TaxID=42233 RepID=A0A8J3Y9J5_9ACTN|nr:suppressor of fused domain protein [Spirilliplanes yamanashiensis]MDP9815543.1 hypothetical protein [Spirilliplanes yamanashiensis]GIJ03797.1 hypothetical protein Sya03_31490 [Spirilliplanes yamanashiensis]